ncbi:helix-turn-helix domain-containing protein, partial [Pediococcus pentosaceus]|uniref:helix-turn-helix domain-containing protein n=1 Tax=Pediococcus pentosaceus TaxID=1255 RepID=UPI0038324BD4
MICGIYDTYMVDCKINPTLFGQKDQLPLKWCLPHTHLLGADLLSSITYSERIKIETFCELGLSNIQMGVRLNRSPSTISYELSR